jgi:hypothetical protein
MSRTPHLPHPRRRHTGAPTAVAGLQVAASYDVAASVVYKKNIVLFLQEMNKGVWLRMGVWSSLGFLLLGPVI